MATDIAQTPPESLCFLHARTKPEKEWTWHMIQHMRGVRHRSRCEKTPEPVTPRLDPVGHSIRTLALTKGYETLDEHEAKMYQQLVLHALNGDIEAVKARFDCVKALRDPFLNPLQPVTVSGALRGHMPVLIFGLDNGAEVNRDVALAVQKGAATGSSPVDTYYLANKTAFDDLVEYRPYEPRDPWCAEIIARAIRKTEHMW